MALKDTNDSSSLNKFSPNRGLTVKDIEPTQATKGGVVNEKIPQEVYRTAPKMNTNGGGFGSGVDYGSFPSNPFTDPSFRGTHLRILASVAGNKTTGHITYGDSARQKSGTAATNIAKSKLKNPDPKRKGEELSENEYWSSKRNQNRDPYNEKGVTYDLPISKWIAGVKVIDSLTMTSPSYTTIDNKGEEVTVSAGIVEIQNIMMNISQAKNIVKTKIAGRDGSVHQYINMDDYVIECWGQIIGYEDTNANASKDGVTASGGGYSQGERPEIAIREFVQFMERPTQVSIGCDILNIIGVDRAIVVDFKLTQEIGKLDNQGFRFKMWSDKPFEIFVEDRI
jgi:hypothetical protein